MPLDNHRQEDIRNSKTQASWMQNRQGASWACSGQKCGPVGDPSADSDASGACSGRFRGPVGDPSVSLDAPETCSSRRCGPVGDPSADSDASGACSGRFRGPVRHPSASLDAPGARSGRLRGPVRHPSAPSYLRHHTQKRTPIHAEPRCASELPSATTATAGAARLPSAGPLSPRSELRSSCPNRARSWGRP